MKITRALRQWLDEMGFAPEGASDDEFRRAAAIAITSGELSSEEYAELTQPVSGGDAKEKLKGLVREVISESGSAAGSEDMHRSSGHSTNPAVKVFGTANVAGGHAKWDDGSAGGGDHIRVKGVDEKFCTKRYPFKHPKTGDTVVDKGRELDLPSQLDDAVLGAWVHMKALQQGYRPRGHDVPPLDELKTNLIKYALHEREFIGELGDQYLHRRKLSEHHRKALLDDATSGGSSLIPFDLDLDFASPLLVFGEVFPRVTLRETRRNQVRINTSSTVSPAWGTAPGTAITPETTTGFITSVDADVERVSGAMEISLDLLDDTPQALGEEVRQQYNQAMSSELDRVVLHGNGTTEPLGILNTAGTAPFSTASGTAGPIVISDVSGLFFTVPHQYRKRNLGLTFVMNDSLYASIREISTGVTGDTRFVLGLDIASYRFFEGMGETPVAIQQDMLDSDAICAPLRHYRMYRRSGFSFRWETGGNYLALRGLGLLVATGRFAGRLTLPSSVAEGNDFPNPNLA